MYRPFPLEPEAFSRPIDVIARRKHYIDHIAPVWRLLNNKGDFYVPKHIAEYAESQGVTPTIAKQKGSKRTSIRVYGHNVLFVSGYHDLEVGFQADPHRPFILMEHGVGLSFSGMPGYAGGEGLRRRVHLFLAPNEDIYKKTMRAFPDAPQVIIGTPKMDHIFPEKPQPKENPVVAISFHWDGKAVCPEAGNALDHYKGVLGALADNFTMIGHGHPRIIDRLAPIYNNCGITWIEHDFEEVMRQADIYINDASSTLYEFSCTGKPVIILNAPWFRRDVHHGIRFWDYTDIGINVDHPNELVRAVKDTARNPMLHYKERLYMIESLYPYLGSSAQTAADAINIYLGEKSNASKS